MAGTGAGAALVVHCLEDIRRARRAAARVGRPLTVCSATGAGASLGPLVFREMIAATAREADGAEIDARFDCGDQPGQALRALREGCTGLILDAPDAVMAKLGAIARAQGGDVMPPPAARLDLGLAPLSDDEIAAWLGAHL